MKLKIGDKVRFLNETGEGIVTRFKDKETVFVEVSEGFEIPYPARQLVPIHTELILNSETDGSLGIHETTVNEAIYFVIEPDHELPILVNEYNLYLFNSSSYSLMYTYSVRDEAYFQTLKHGEAGTNQKVLLKQVKFPFFKEYAYHKLECLLFKNTHFKTQLPITETIFVNHKNLDERNLVKHNGFKFPVHLFLLKDQFAVFENVKQELNSDDVARLNDMKEYKSKTGTSKSHKEQLKKLEAEVDLHIEELVDNVSGLNHHQILTIQIERFEKELDKAILNGIKKVVFIHGVGNGRLKHEIQNRLKLTEGLTFQDASYRLYGYGATQVNIL
jgi:hypothetical protein